MKTLFLFRHAKPVSGAESLRDFDRTLNDEGRGQAESVGKYLKDKNLELDLVLSSTALRARETTELVLRAAKYVTEVRYDQRMYEANRQQLLEVISEIEASKNKVLLVGHNPAMEELLRQLTGRFEPMATANLAKIDLDISEWTEATERKGHLDWLVKPEELASG